MRLKTPYFWYNTDKFKSRIQSYSLLPLASAYYIGYKTHQQFGKPYKANIPVICIGNLIAGGAGKTPSVLALLKLINQKKLFNAPFCLSRGYGGQEQGPLIIKPEHHNAIDVGDEPLLLSGYSKCIVSKNRAEGARLAEQKGADLIIMDDGLQNNSLHKTLKFAVVNGTYGFGNKKLIPAGPLREPLHEGMKNSDAFILIGQDTQDVKSIIPENKPIFKAQLSVPESWIYNQETPYIAFSGMAHPEKFHSTLWSKGINVIGWHTFPDHYNFSKEDIHKIAEDAKSKKARLITTEKDFVRIPSDINFDITIDVMPITLIWEKPDELTEFIMSKISYDE
jgi:tetraacyldisaccharide 4'-kinase